MKQRLTKLAWISAMSVLGLPLVAAACKNNNNSIFRHPKAPVTPVTSVKLNDSFKLTEEQVKNFDRKIVMITDGGDINDKSFNQSTWEGVLYFADVQAKLDRSKYGILEVKNHKFDEAYKQALQSGYNVWVLPGFLHQKHIKSWIKNNKEAVEKNNIVIICQDFTTNDSDHVKGFSVFQEFKTREAAFVAGYGAAKFLSSFENEKDRTFGSFGGGAFTAVTDFIEGFMKGVYYWNKQQTDDKKKVYSSSKEIDLSSGFDTGTKMDAVVNKVLSQDPKMIMAVAGPATAVLYNNPKFRNKYVVGIDADQAIAAPENKKNSFFTSITKELAQAAYDAIGLISTSKIDTLKTKQESLGGFTLAKEDGKQFEGWDKKWVGVTKTYIDEAGKKELATEALKAGEEAFTKLDEETKKWLNNSKKATPDSQDINTIQEMLNKLAVELSKK